MKIQVEESTLDKTGFNVYEMDHIMQAGPSSNVVFVNIHKLHKKKR